MITTALMRSSMSRMHDRPVSPPQSWTTSVTLVRSNFLQNSRRVRRCISCE
jgi:hypothetical protein